MEFGRKIERLLAERGWTNAELARRARVSPTTVGNWIAGDRRPYQDVLLTLADTFGVPVDFLVHDDQDVPPAPTISEDERAVVDLYRALRPVGLDKEGALRALSLAVQSSILDSLAPGESIEITHGVTLRELDPRTGRPIDAPRKKGAG